MSAFIERKRVQEADPSEVFIDKNNNDTASYKDPRTNKAVPLGKETFESVKFTDGTEQQTAVNTLLSAGGGISLVESVGPKGQKVYTINSSVSVPPIEYSNVAIVDVQKGFNVPTAAIGRFDLPFINIPSAISAALATSPTATARALVYIRKGVYSATMTLQDNVDIYCEPGVVFVNGQISAFSGTTNFLGKARFNVISRMLLVNGNVNFNFEFDTIDGLFCFEVGSISSGNVNISGRYIRTGLGTNIGITLRGAANVTLNIDEEITGYQEVINFRYASGNIVINCPRIKLLNGNYSGGNFKSALKFYENYGARVTVNGDLINEDPVYYGGTAGMIGFWVAPNVKLTLNGNIYANGNLGTFLSSGTNAECTINGSITSNTEPIYVSSGVTLVVKGGNLSYPAGGAYRLAYIDGTAKVFIAECQFNNKTIDSPTIEISPAATADVNIHNCVAEGIGTGNFILCSNPVNVRLHNVRANQALSANVTDVLTPSGFINDPQIKTIYFS